MVIKYLIPLSSPMATLSPLLQKGESKRLVRYTFTYPPPPLSRSLPLKHKGEAKGLV